MELHAAEILTALAATVFAAGFAADRAKFAAATAAFVVASAAQAWLGSPPVSALAFLVVAAAAAAAIKPNWRTLNPAAAGVLAAAWAAILEAQGLPLSVATIGAAALLAAAAAFAARRAGFVTSDVRDEALVIVASFGLLLAVVPDAVDGWRSAGAFAARPIAGEDTQVGPWLAILTLGSVLLGALYTTWKRR